MKIFIGCSSSDEIDPTYFPSANIIGETLKEHHLIIGGTKVGLIGNVIQNTENYTQIIVKDYLEDPKKDDHIIICDTSFERMQTIWNESDLFLFLEGGLGTLAEIISFIEENRTHEKKKKIIILNSNNYYDNIVKFIQEGITKKFISKEILENVIVITDSNHFEKYIKNDKIEGEKEK